MERSGNWPPTKQEQKKFQKRKQKNQQIADQSLKILMLKELKLDFDWKAAGKRLGLSHSVVERLKRDRDFLELGQEIISDATKDIGGMSEAVDKFNDTQKLLKQNLEEGELSVASALVKTHELEYRMHGLFEKDNRQKASNVSVAIFLDEPNQRDEPIDVEGEILDDEEEELP